MDPAATHRGFTRHAFISYSHIDNQPLPAEPAGWVTIFHAALEQFLSRFLGGKASIWRDEKLRGNDDFSEEILAQLPTAAALVMVLTPRYLNSEWCTRELNAFCEAVRAAKGPGDDSKSRIFKVIKTPVQNEAALPQEVSRVLGYEFFKFDDERTPRELDPVFGAQERQEFLRKVNKLAWDIKVLIERQLGAPQSASASAQTRPVVYLAESGRDRREQREALAVELQRAGYEVVPNQPLPADEAEYITAVRELLLRSRLSLHPVGASPGPIPDGSGQKTITQLQNDIAMEVARPGQLERIVWLPEGTRSPVTGHQVFIDAVQRDAALLGGADLFTGDLEGMKSIVLGALARLERSQARPQPAEREGQRKIVYLRCDERDRSAAVPMVKLLRNAGLQVQLPVFTGGAADVREANQELYKQCDAVMLYYGAGDEAWKHFQLSELRKLRALRPTAPVQFTVLGLPNNDDKELLVQLEELGLLDCRGGFTETALAPLIRALRGMAP